MGDFGARGGLCFAEAFSAKLTLELSQAGASVLNNIVKPLLPLSDNVKKSQAAPSYLGRSRLGRQISASNSRR
jgi:hypothetical protein